MTQNKTGYAIVYTISDMKRFLNEHAGCQFTISEEDDYPAETLAAKERDMMILEKFEECFKSKTLSNFK